MNIGFYYIYIQKYTNGYTNNKTMKKISLNIYIFLNHP